VPEPRIPLIHNPSARSQRSQRLAGLLDRLAPAPRRLVTRGGGDAREMAAQCARDGAATVAAAGGDGTVSEVVAGLLDAAAEGYPIPRLGVMPAGTMNVFSLELGLPQRNLRQCWNIIANGKTREVDLWLANGLPLVQLGGVGLDASVVKETTWEQKKLLGPLSYALNTLRVLARPAPDLEIEVDGEIHRGALALFGNGCRYGGPITVFPGAKLDDGLLDLLILHRQKTPDLLGFLGAMLSGQLSHFPGISLLRGREISVRHAGAHPVPCEIDGEVAGETPLQIHAAATRLPVAVA